MDLRDDRYEYWNDRCRLDLSKYTSKDVDSILRDQNERVLLNFEISTVSSAAASASKSILTLILVNLVFLPLRL